MDRDELKKIADEIEEAASDLENVIRWINEDGGIEGGMEELEDAMKCCYANSDKLRKMASGEGGPGE